MRLSSSSSSSKKRQATLEPGSDEEDSASDAKRAARAGDDQETYMSHIGYFVRSGNCEEMVKDFLRKSKKRTAVLDGPERDAINGVEIGQEMPILPHVVTNVILKLTVGLSKFSGEHMLKNLKKLIKYGHWEGQLHRTVTSMLIFLKEKQEGGWDGFNDEIEQYDILSSKILNIIGIRDDEGYDELAKRAMKIGLQRMSLNLYSRLPLEQTLLALASSNPKALIRTLSNPELSLFNNKTDGVMKTYLDTLQLKGLTEGTKKGTLWITTNPHDILLSLQRVDPSTTNSAYYGLHALRALEAWTQVPCKPPVRASVMLSFLLNLRNLYYLELGRQEGARRILSTEQSLDTLRSKYEDEEDGSLPEIPESLRSDSEEMPDSRIVRRDALLRRWRLYHHPAE